MQGRDIREPGRDHRFGDIECAKEPLEILLKFRNGEYDDRAARFRQSFRIERKAMGPEVPCAAK